MAIGPFTVSSHRQTAIDFTQPYIDLGLSILIKKNEQTGYKVFSFLEPFDTGLWLAIIFTMFITGLFLWLHSTFSPRGYRGRCAQARDDCDVRDDRERSWGLLWIVDAVWSSYSYGVGQGSDVSHPVSTSGRIVVAVWWFAALIISEFLQVKVILADIKELKQLQLTKPRTNSEAPTGFEPMTSAVPVKPRFVYNCFLLHNCEDHFHVYSLSALHSYYLDLMHSMPSEFLYAKIC